MRACDYAVEQEAMSDAQYAISMMITLSHKAYGISQCKMQIPLPRFVPKPGPKREAPPEMRLPFICRSKRPKKGKMREVRPVGFFRMATLTSGEKVSFKKVNLHNKNGTVSVCQFFTEMYGLINHSSFLIIQGHCFVRVRHQVYSSKV